LIGLVDLVAEITVLELSSTISIAANRIVMQNIFEFSQFTAEPDTQLIRRPASTLLFHSRSIHAE